MKGEIVIDNYNPFGEIIKDNRFVMDEKVEIGNKIIINAHLIENKDIKCSVCHKSNLIHHGYVYRKIIDRLYPDYYTIIHLKLQKFKCKDCGSIISDSSTIVEKNSSISIHLKLLILEKLRNDTSLASIAKEYGLSKQEIYNIFLTNVNISRHRMPEVLCIDEFKNLKTEEGSYAVVLYDPINHLIIDVIRNRQMNTLEEYFYHVDNKELDKVKYFISDMFESFRSIKKRFFKNATHIVDGFHFSRYVFDAFDSERIRIMKTYETKDNEYKILKRYRKLFLSKLDDVNIKIKSYNPFKKEKTSVSDIIRDALDLNDELSNAYSIKETYVKMEDRIKYETREAELKDIILLFNNSNIKEYIAVGSMFEHWFDEICNSFIRFGDKRLNNAYIEGINNRIKEIKKISYGCKNFYYFRNRLMFVINANEPLTQVNLINVPKTAKVKVKDTK